MRSAVCLLANSIWISCSFVLAIVGCNSKSREAGSVFSTKVVKTGNVGVVSLIQDAFCAVVAPNPESSSMTRCSNDALSLFFEMPNCGME